MKNTILKFGAYGFVLGFVLFLAGLYFDITTNVAIGYATIIVCLSFVYFGIKHFRDHENEGAISFKEGFIIGLLITLFTAVGFALADFIYTAMINPDFYADHAAKMREQNPSEEIKAYSSGFGALFMFIVVMVIGMIISLISSLILKRKN